MAANSFYGVLGNLYSRFHDRSIAESVTQAGVWLIEQTIAAVKQRGWRAIYSDTDSCCVAGVGEEEFASFVAWCNAELYPKILQQQGCRTNAVKIAYEKEFDRLVLVSAKRYCASFVHFKGKRATENSKPEIKGLEYRRGDTSKLARELQARAIDGLVGGLKLSEGVMVPTVDRDHFRRLIYAQQQHVLHGELTIEDVVIAKALGKPMEQYGGVRSDGAAGVVPAHVKVALMMKKRGEELGEGAKVEYVVTDGSISPQVVDFASEYKRVDRYYLWEKKVFPPTRDLLKAAFPEVDWGLEFGKVRPKVVKGRRRSVVQNT